MDAKKESNKILVRVSRDKIRRTKLFVKEEKTGDGTILTLSDGLTAEVDQSGKKIMIYNLEVVDDDDSPVTEKKITDDQREEIKRLRDRIITSGEEAAESIRNNSPKPSRSSEPQR